MLCNVMFVSADVGFLCERPTVPGLVIKRLCSSSSGGGGDGGGGGGGGGGEIRMRCRHF